MKLHSNVFGEGKPFLILHGFLGMGDNWKTLGKKFSTYQFEVHLIDQRNHGRSPHSLDFNYELMVEDLLEYCRDRDLKEVVLLGHSMGGKTAMLFAALHSHLVEKLIIADIAPRYYAPHHQDILDGLVSMDFTEIMTRGDADKALGVYVKNSGVRMFLLKNLYWKAKNQLGLRINLQSIVANSSEIGTALPSDLSYDGEALFLKGEKSNYISKEDELAIKSRFTKVKMVEIPSAGHWLHAENPVIFLEEVLDFLKI